MVLSCFQLGTSRSLFKYDTAAWSDCVKKQLLFQNVRLQIDGRF